jgi:hypothetical protein
MKLPLIFAGVIAVAASVPLHGQEVVINEIMYNTPSADPTEEWIELYNRGTTAVNLLGWRISDGVDFTFGNVTIPAGGYLVVAADTEAFGGLFPGVANVVGGWLGTLSNNGEGVEVENAAGDQIDRVRYATDGDWGIRRRLPDPNTGTLGWDWTADHDGIGKSVELINAALSNDNGQNWGPSAPVGGTPGAANSLADADIAPLISESTHSPTVPSSTTAVTISARVTDEQSSGVVVQLFYRTLQNPFIQLDMLDNGLSGDGGAGDGIYAATVPAMGDRTAVEFYIQASDAGSNIRTYPAPGINQVGAPAQVLNMVYQVDDSVYTGTQPFYRIILTEANRVELQNLNRQSDAEVHCTFVTVDGVETQVRHNCGVRTRGAGSRNANPSNYRLNIPNDNPWKDLDAINLNTQFTHAQAVGSVVAQRSGMAAADARLVQVRVNGINLAGAGSPQFGSYVAVEPINSEFAENHYPNDPDGNVYRASSGSHQADLSYRSDPASLRAAGYSKTSNTSEDDWSDLINLTFVLNNTPEANYTATISSFVDVRQWMKHFAVMTMMAYGETALGTGEGDDYALYRGMIDQRFDLLVHDFDTIFGQGGGGNVSQGLFLAADFGDQPAVARFLTWRDFVPIYYDELLWMANNPFSPAELFPVFDRVMGGVVPEPTINAMKTFATNRVAFVKSQIPLNIRVVTNALPFVNGYLTTTSSAILLNGFGNVIETRSVRVGGNVATWNPVGGSWSNVVNLVPGINRVLVQTFNAQGQEFERAFVDIVCNDSSIGVIPTTITTDLTLTAAGGPYEVTTMITVAAGATLTIEPGTTFYFEQSTGFIVNGRLVAEGTETQRIRFTRSPSANTTWSGIRFNNSNQDNRITYADFDFAAAADPVVLVNSRLLIENVTWVNTTRTIIDLTNSSLICRNSVFPRIIDNETIHGQTMPATGYVIIEGNYFGGTTGYSDIIDFTGGKRPGPILQVLNNVFDGGSDDAVDLDDTDAHIEGNLFQHIHQDAPRDSAAHAIATDFGAEITVVRNVFYDNDHAVLLKNGSFLTAENNTIVGCTFAAISFDETNRTVNPGRGALMDGCIFWNNAALFRHLYFNHPVETNTDLTIVRSLVQGTNHPGVGNINADPLFVNNTSDFHLRPGSPATGTGPNGLDMGAYVPAGASISGEPPPVTHQTLVQLTVDGPGITHYRYRVNSGTFGPETPITQPITLSALTNGNYQVFVIGKNSAAVWQPETNATASRMWTINTSLPTVRINELLARNDTAVPVSGEFPDLVELYNAGNTVNLSGMGLTDDPDEPFKFIFPTGLTISGGGYLTLYADNETGPGYHLGFGLSQNGDELLLFSATGVLIDRITFGLQIPDYSIGRLADHSWGLTRPTFGARNIPQSASDAHALKINEWLASPGGLFSEDFVELYNPLPVPAHLGGAYLTDAPQSAPMRHRVPALSFVPANGFVVLTADGNTNDASHLNFKLSGDQGEIALFASDGILVDHIVYGPQTRGIAEGRIPSGSETIGRINPPTPGGPNPGSIPVVETVTLNLTSLASDWRFEATGTDLGSDWRTTNFDDSSWPIGAALLANENCNCLPAPFINTVLPLNAGAQIVTYYFRQTFVLNTNVTGFSISASTVIDDGAVIYINGQEAQRIRMPLFGDITYNTQALGPSVNNASLETWVLTNRNLVLGTNVIAVEVHQAELPSSDIAFGLALNATRTFTNFPSVPIVLNEVLANNATIAHSGETNITDWVELHNLSTNAVDLSDMSLTDNAATPRRWAVPAGVSIPPGGYLLVRFDATLPVSTNNTGVLNTGFGLSAGGDEVYLYDRLSRGGGLLDSLLFGIQAPDLSIGRIPNAIGTWSLNLATPGSGNVPASLGDPMSLRINEWLASPPGNDDDFFELYNPSAQPVSLGGLFLTDALGDRTMHRIANLSFIGSGQDGFVRFVADNNTGAGADHVNFALRAAGEAIGLFTAVGTQIDAVTFGAQQNGVSEGRFPDGATNIEAFPGTPTPGRSNLRAITEIVISEVLTHTDLPLEDAIELQNVSHGAVDISGWWISDSQNDPKKFRIPQGTVLQPGGFIVFYENQFNPLPDTYPSFSLSSVNGDEVFLFTANTVGDLTGYRTGVRFGAAANGVSFGRYETSVGFDFTALRQRQFGVDAPSTVQQFRTGTGLSNAPARIGDVLITEIMYNPPGIGTNDGSTFEFVELHNIRGFTVSLFDPNFPTNTWRLRDAVDFDFPQNVTLPAGGYLLVVSFNPTDTTALNAFRARYGLSTTVPVYGPYDGRLDNAGENVELYLPDPPQPLTVPQAGFVPYIETERVKYSDASPWPVAADGYTNGVGASLQRRMPPNPVYANDPVNWIAGTPTPGGPTGSALVAEPSITTQPVAQTVGAGGSVTFTVAATGASPLTYQWRLNGVNIPGATATSLTLNGVQLPQAGEYSVLVVNSAGAAVSARANLVVQAPPVITQQPQTRSVAAGSLAVFTVAAQGTSPLSYQWQRDGVNLAGATRASLAITNVQPANQGAYRVIVANSFGSVTSIVATLAISAAPAIVSQPQGTNVFVGASVTFTVTVSGSPPLRYQWRRNNVAISGATNATLTLNNLQTTDTGNYSVFVTNDVGAALSAPATLTVTVPPVVTVAANDANASEPGSNTGTFQVSRTGNTSVGLIANFNVTGSALSGSDYQAIASPVLIPPGSSSVNITVTPLNDSLPEGNETVVLTIGTSSEYVIGAQSAATVIIFDEDNARPSVTLTNPIAGASFNAGANVPLGATAADSDGSISKVEFYYDATNRIGEVTAPPYAFIWSNAPSGPRVLTAVATDNLGSTTESAPVNVSINLRPTVAITSPANGANFFAPASVPITATASDPGGSVSSVEFYAGTNLISSDSSPPYNATFASVPVGNYILTARAIDNEGAAGVSAPVTISVTVAPPAFNDTFASRGLINGFTNFVTGNSSAYTKEAGEPRHDNKTGTRSAWIEWIAPGNGICTIDTFGSSFDTVLAVYRGTSVASLALVASNDDASETTLQSLVTFTATAGTAYVIAIDGYSAGQGGAFMLHLGLPNVATPPVITQQPVSRTVDPGAAATFTVGASGSAPLRYQWRFNTVAIPNQTNAALILSNVQHTNSGAYAVLVSNSAGSVLSQSALLMVRPQLSGRRLANGHFELNYKAAPGNYVLEVSTNLTSWATLQNVNPVIVDGQVIDTEAPAHSRRSYRLRYNP